MNTEVTTTQTVGTTTKAVHRTPGPVQRDDLKELTHLEAVVGAVQREPYATKLVGYEMDASFVVTLAAETSQCRNLFADAVQGVDYKRGLTKTAATAKKSLMQLLRKVQAAASAKYARDPLYSATLKDYYIGVSLTDSAAKLAQFSEAIIEKLGEDTLPGITPATITALRTSRSEWLGAQDGQQAAQEEATRKRTQAQALLRTLTDRRIRILYAIEAEYPYSGDPESVKATRALFGLPATRPFRVRQK